MPVQSNQGTSGHCLQPHNRAAALNCRLTFAQQEITTILSSMDASQMLPEQGLKSCCRRPHLKEGRGHCVEQG